MQREEEPRSVMEQNWTYIKHKRKHILTSISNIIPKIIEL